ncbi:hypothetical protein C8R44DRAFT_740389 [Mycena epipterygia]|nr:hypothetical protein C8R44DRAFT_740389 [Mycena epipterygia]
MSSAISGILFGSLLWCASPSPSASDDLPPFAVIGAFSNETEFGTLMADPFSGSNAFEVRTTGSKLNSGSRKIVQWQALRLTTIEERCTIVSRTAAERKRRAQHGVEASPESLEAAKPAQKEDKGRQEWVTLQNQ